MSYILDALKKSEQERGHGSVPGVQTVHSSALNYHQEKRPLWPWLLIAVLLANIFILVYLLKPETTVSAAAPETAATINPAAVAPPITDPVTSPVTISPEPAAAPVAIAQPANAAPVAASAPAPAPVASVSYAAPAPKPVNAYQTVVDIDDLPPHIRQQIPELVFSAHVYSTDPAQRSLVINNRFMEEGDAVGYDLVLEEITRGGAIFNFRGERFSTSVLSGWNTP